MLEGTFFNSILVGVFVISWVSLINCSFIYIKVIITNIKVPIITYDTHYSIIDQEDTEIIQKHAPKMYT